MFFTLARNSCRNISIGIALGFLASVVWSSGALAETLPSQEAGRGETTHLPDGYFSGPLLVIPEEGAAPVEVGQLKIQIVHGFIVSAIAETTGEEGAIALRPMTAPDDPELRMNGRAGRGFIRVHGGFWDPRAAMGAFDGVIANQKARGVWTVTRR